MGMATGAWQWSYHSQTLVHQRQVLLPDAQLWRMCGCAGTQDNIGSANISSTCHSQQEGTA